MRGVCDTNATKTQYTFEKFSFLFFILFFIFFIISEPDIMFNDSRIISLFALSQLIVRVHMVLQVNIQTMYLLHEDKKYLSIKNPQVIFSRRCLVLYFCQACGHKLKDFISF